MLRAPLVFPHSRKLIWIFQPCSPRKPTVLEPHDRGIPFNPESVCPGHLPLFWCLQRRWKWQVRNHSHASRLSLTECFRSPGYALTLLAESTTFATYCAEAISEPGIAPEDVGLKATRALLAEIEKGGCVDQRHQILVLLMMVLGSEDVGRCRMSEPTSKTWVPFRGWVSPALSTSYRIQFLRDVKAFFGTSFKIVPADPSDPECTQLLYSCYGTGYVNANRTLS